MNYGVFHKQGVTRLLREFGYNLTFRRVLNQGSSNYDPNTSTTGTPNNDDETVFGVMINRQDYEVDGRVIRGARKVLMRAEQADGSPLTKEPQANDRIVGEDETVSVINARKIKARNVVIAYVLEVEN
jgi:hypothetical protein